MSKRAGAAELSLPVFANPTGLIVQARQVEFERIAMPHSRSLLRVAYRLTSSSSAAEDLVQETLLAGWRNFHQFQPGSNIRAWLFRILINHFHSQGRKLRPMPEMAPMPADLPGHFAAPDDAMEMARALECLEADHRAVLLLAVTEGFTCREIAGILGIPIGTVMSRLSRARQAMRELLTTRRRGVEYAGRDS